MKNQDIRQAAKESNIKLWQIADALNIRDCELSRKLRYELSEKEKLQIRYIIAELAEGEIE